MEINILWDIGKGLLTGVATALVGYIKALPDGDKLDWKKYTPTLIIGGIAGVVAYFVGVDWNTATALVAGFGAVTLVNSLWVAALKKYVKTKSRKQRL